MAYLSLNFCERSIHLTGASVFEFLQMQFFWANDRLNSAINLDPKKEVIYQFIYRDSNIVAHSIASSCFRFGDFELPGLLVS